jgi:hypothetical protein
VAQRRCPGTIRADRHVHRHPARLLLDQLCTTTAALHAELRVTLPEGVAPADTVGPGSLSPTVTKDHHCGGNITGHEWAWRRVG